MNARLESQTGPKAPTEFQQEPASQRRKADAGQFRLQVDRQTKSSYASYEAAEEAGLEIKRSHPIVSVTVYDSIEGINTPINLPNVSGELV
jgi:hypothetical protein